MLPLGFKSTFKITASICHLKACWSMYENVSEEMLYRHTLKMFHPITACLGAFLSFLFEDIRKNKLIENIDLHL